MHNVPPGCRPKHQVLILKCYPKFQKSKLEVKPNSSELSYLLYYASTRRSKLPKVGAFLENKTTHDISRRRIGDVQVTLQILKALVEKCSRELPLFALFVLRTLDIILRARDITLVEESVPVFETFCAHRDSASLSADENYIHLYDQVAKAYVAFASKETPVKTKSPISIPISIRFRSAGLQAIKSMVSSESLVLESNRQLRAIIPVILQNLYSEKHNYLSLLQQREQAQERFEKDQSLRRRQSLSIGHTNDATETDPSTAGDTTADLDERADEEVGVVALQSLRLIFAANNRGQLRSSIHAVLNFVTNRNCAQKSPGSDDSWYTGLFKTISQWTPVQDRFIILVVVMESLVRSPIVENDLPRQLVKAKVVGGLLRSSIIFIGLSVMDVLVGLIQHSLLLLQLSADAARLSPSQQQLISLDNKEDSFTVPQKRPVSNGVVEPAVTEVVSEPSAARKETLEELEKCIGHLATHIYYSDQISDMVSALLSRLTPIPMPGSNATALAIDNPLQARNAIAESFNLNEKRHTSGFFSFETARLIALRAVKQILSVANARRSDGRNATVRNKVGVSVWDGTQWLLRDPNGSIRKAYTDALLTWLRLEMDKSDARRIEKQVKPLTYARKDPEQLCNGNKLVRRALSNASERDKAKKPSKSPFFQLIQVAIYENAIQYAESEPDILLLHLLSTVLIQELGINSIRFGLPMIFRLQDEISNINGSTAQISVGSLVLGYLWNVVKAFDLEASPVGKELQYEFSRRSEKKIWLNTIRAPPIPIEKLGSPENLENLRKNNESAIHAESLQPFGSREALVESIAESYSDMALSPPSSPPLSPHRRFSISQISAVKTPLSFSPVQRQFPERVKEQMLTEWTKATCIAAAEKANTKATSLGGSKVGTGSRNFLTVDVLPGTANGTRTPSPRRDESNTPSHPPSAVFGLIGGGRAAIHEIFRHESRCSSPIRISHSSSQSVMRVKEMKKALGGNYDPQVLQHNEYANDNESESMVSADVSGSEISMARQRTFSATAPERPDSQPRPRSSGSSRSPPLRPSTDVADYDIPPVPPLPPALHVTAETPLSEDVQKQLGGTRFDGVPLANKTNEIQNGVPSVENSFDGPQTLPSGRRNLNDLLSGIITNGARPGSSMGPPPY